MEEQIAKAEWWWSQGASCAHPDGGPDAETSMALKQGWGGQGARPAACFSSPCVLSLSQCAQDLPSTLSPPSLGLCSDPLTSPFSQGQPPPPGASSPAHHPLLPGVSQPPSPGGEKPVGEGSKDLEEGRNPEFLRGVGA